MDNFDKLDKKGTAKVINFLNEKAEKWGLTRVTETKNKSRYDIYASGYTSAGSAYQLIIECKDRYYYSDVYENWFIEKHKYNDVTDIALRNNAIPLYINSFKDNKIRIWNLDESKIVETYKERKKNTAEGTQEIEYQTLFILSNKDSKIYER